MGIYSIMKSGMNCIFLINKKATSRFYDSDQSFMDNKY